MRHLWPHANKTIAVSVSQKSEVKRGLLSSLNLFADPSAPKQLLDDAESLKHAKMVPAVWACADLLWDVLGSATQESHLCTLRNRSR